MSKRFWKYPIRAVDTIVEIKILISLCRRTELTFQLYAVKDGHVKEYWITPYSRIVDNMTFHQTAPKPFEPPDILLSEYNIPMGRYYDNFIFLDREDAERFATIFWGSLN